MPTIQELQDRSVQYRTALSQMRQRYNTDGNISDAEQQDLDEMDALIDQVEAQLDAAQQRENRSSGDGSSAETPVTYTQTSHRT